MIRHHVMTGCVVIVATIVAVRSLCVDAPSESWDSREVSAKLLSKREAPADKPRRGSDTASTVEKWQSRSKFRLAGAISAPQAGHPAVARVHLVSMKNHPSTEPDGDDTVVTQCDDGCPACPQPLQPVQVAPYTSVQPGGTSKGAQCSTATSPGGQGGNCSTSSTTGAAQGYSCSTVANGPQYCSTGASNQVGGGGATTCSTDGGIAGGKTIECSTSSGGTCSTQGQEPQAAVCSTSPNAGNQDCSTGTLSGAPAGSSGAGFCSATNGSGAGQGVCSASSGSGVGANCSVSGATAGQQCSTMGQPVVNAGGSVCSVTQAAPGTSVNNAPNCTAFAGANPAAACSTQGKAAANTCSVMSNGNPVTVINGPANGVCTSNNP
jgi:hypothetical protein